MKEETSDRGEDKRVNPLRPGMADGHIFDSVVQQVE